MRRAWLVLGLAGCNQVFDLASTQIVDAPVADFDGDGVEDAVDNCPALANSDQLNRDGDAFGDACDTCPLVQSATTHDEDRDGLGDACDPCPGTADFGLDGDNDGVGDICDPVPNKMGQPNKRVVFEPFVTMPADWQPGAIGWTQASDAIAPDMPLAATDPGLTDTAITTPGTWMLTIGLDSKSAWDGSDSYGISATSPDDTISCIVTCKTAELGTGCVGIAQRNASIYGSQLIVPQPFIRVSLLVKDFGAPQCVFQNGYYLSAGVVPTDNMRLYVRASPRLRLAYVDYIE